MIGTTASANTSSGAWVIKNQWNVDFIKKFENSLSTKIEELKKDGLKFTCDDLALFLIMEFSWENNLPFKWSTEAEEFDASNGNYSTPYDFILEVQSKSGAADFANDNNTSFTHLNSSDRPGVINVLTSKGKTRPNHIQVITSLAFSELPSMLNNFNGKLLSFNASQGNFNGLGRLFGSDNPSSSRYLGVNIENGIYNFKNNTWTNHTIGTTTSSFYGQNYSNQYRRFNFIKWNK